MKRKPTRRGFGLGIAGLTIGILDGATQEPIEYFTAGSLNGRYWRAASRELKNQYTMAFSEAVVSCVDMCPRTGSDIGKTWPRWAYDVAPPNMNPVELAESLDALYVEPTNRTIPINAMISIVAKKSLGSSAARIEKALEQLRGIFSQP